MTHHTRRTDGTARTEHPLDGFTDLGKLRGRDDVERVETTRSFASPSFENLEARFDAIAGVTQVGVTADDGHVLLAGDETWSPPGTDVLPGEEWAVTTRRQLESILGVDLELDGVALLEDAIFNHEDDDSRQFLAPCVSFEASLTDANTEQSRAFREHPTVAEDLDHPLYGDDAYALGWFDSIPEDVHPNHVEHVELFL